MKRGVRNLAALAGLALALAALILGVSWRSWRSAPPGRAPDVARPGAQERLSTSPTTPQPKGESAGGDVTHPTTPPRRLPPERPHFTELSNKVLKQMQAYMQELWVYSANGVREELDQICASRGADAALDYVRGLVAPGSYIPMPYDEAHHRFVGESATLASFDYEKWFKSLLAVRLVPYIVARGSSPDILRKATDMLLEITRDAKDPVLAGFAASTFSRNESYVTPFFSPVSEGNGGKPVGLSFGFESAGAGFYAQTPGYRESRDTVGALGASLVPMLKDCPWATQEMAQAIEQCHDDGARRLLLKNIGAMPDSQQYGATFLRVATNPQGDMWVRKDALNLLKPYAESRQLRDAVDLGLAASTDNDVREMFIEHVPGLYPLDHHYSDTLQGFVRNGSEDEWVRAASAKGLVAYYAGQMPNPEYRATIDVYLAELVRVDKWDALQDVSDQIVSLRATQFVSTFRALLSSLESSPRPSPKAHKGKVILKGYVEELDPRGSH